VVVIRCPKCKCVKFLSKDGDVMWRQLLHVEESALTAIYCSNLLLALVGGYQEYEEKCYICNAAEKN